MIVRPKITCFSVIFMQHFKKKTSFSENFFYAANQDSLLLLNGILRSVCLNFCLNGTTPFPSSFLQHCIRQDGATSEAASPAVPPTMLGTSVQGLTQRFEQLFLRNASSSPTSTANRHHGTKLTMRAIGTNFKWTLR